MDKDQCTKCDTGADLKIAQEENAKLKAVLRKWVELSISGRLCTGKIGCAVDGGSKTCDIRNTEKESRKLLGME